MPGDAQAVLQGRAVEGAPALGRHAGCGRGGVTAVPKHPSPDLPRLVRLTRGLRPGCYRPSEARGAGSAGLENLGSHHRGSRPSVLPRRVWGGQPFSLRPGESHPDAGKGKAGTGCFGWCFGCAVERVLV